MNELKVGDKIISKYGFGGMTVRYIDRTTKTRAYSDQVAYLKEYYDDGTIDPYPHRSGYNSPTHHIATNKLMREFTELKMRRVVTDTKWDNVDFDKIRRIYDILSEVL